MSGIAQSQDQPAPSHTGQRDNHSRRGERHGVDRRTEKTHRKRRVRPCRKHGSEKKQRHYDARLQFNACKGGFDYDFKGIARRQEQTAAQEQEQNRQQGVGW